MTKKELCCKCDDPTGLAGKYEDSLFRKDGTGPYCPACYIKGALQEGLKHFLRERCTPEAIANIKATIWNNLHTLAARGEDIVLEEIEFQLSFSKNDPTSILVVPTDLYSALVLQFAHNGIPGCEHMPPRCLLEGVTEWTDPVGCVWSFHDGHLYVNPPLPVNFIKLNVALEEK
jgi:hypothetical protein